MRTKLPSTPFGCWTPSVYLTFQLIEISHKIFYANDCQILKLMKFIAVYKNFSCPECQICKLFFSWQIISLLLLNGLQFTELHSFFYNKFPEQMFNNLFSTSQAQGFSFILSHIQTSNRHLTDLRKFTLHSDSNSCRSFLS